MVISLDSYQSNLVQKVQKNFHRFFFASFAPLREAFSFPIYPGQDPK